MDTAFTGYRYHARTCQLCSNEKSVRCSSHCSRFNSTMEQAKEEAGIKVHHDCMITSSLHDEAHYKS